MSGQDSGGTNDYQNRPGHEVLIEAFKLLTGDSGSGSSDSGNSGNSDSSSGEKTEGQG